MAGEDGWGRNEGRQTFVRLLDLLEANPSQRVFQLSLAGVRRVDAAFCREAVLELARRFRTKRGVCLCDAADDDLVENFDAAALRLQEPLTQWSSGVGVVLGPQPTEGTREILEYVLQVPNTTASECSARFGLQIANSSNKLKHLFENGYLLRSERPSGSGGIEHVYSRIG